jgi:hypothetical protein
MMPPISMSPAPARVEHIPGRTAPHRRGRRFDGALPYRLRTIATFGIPTTDVKNGFSAMMSRYRR